MSAAADTDGSGFESQGAHHHSQKVPRVLSPRGSLRGGGTASVRGCPTETRTRLEGGLEKIGGLYGRIPPSQQMGERGPYTSPEDMIALQP